MVSVIITTYNRRGFVEQALKSVLEQRYTDREVILIDDGSTDGTCDMVNISEVRYEWKENGGISSARNRGIAMAHGEYIAFLDVDDLWKKDKLAIQMSRMETDGSLISYTDEIWIKNGKWVNQGKRHRKYSGHIYAHCLPLCIISPSSVVIRREIFSEVGLFDESLPVCEDYDLWLRICSRYPVLYIPQPLIVKHGGHSDQLSHSYEVMDKYRIASLAKMLDAGTLTMEQAEATAEELRKKCSIVAKGAQKRGRKEEADYYYILSEKHRRPSISTV
jgi:glycosyltransferase involved in cell wall biosynthesis